MADRRSVRLALLALVALCLVLLDAQLAFAALPALLVVAIPLSGRFLGEALIVARRSVRAVRRRVTASRWPALRHAPVTLLERSPRTERGPPVAA